MKLLIKILFTFSVCLNSYFVWDTIRYNNSKLREEMMNKSFGGDVNSTTWKNGFNLLVDRLKEIDKTKVNKKYYYVNVWTTWCKPCIREMPWLDSLAGTLNKDVAYIFVSDIEDKRANNCISEKGYNIRNFLFINDMNDFISAICNEKGATSKVYPMVLILDNKGNFVHYSTGAYQSAKDVSEFGALIKGLK